MVAAAAATSVLSLCGSPAFADSHAEGAAQNSPGVASGNTVQVPVEVPVNVCGNSIDVVGVLNPAFGNECENSSDEQVHGEYGSHGDHGSQSDDSRGHGSSGHDSRGHGSHGDGSRDHGGSGHGSEQDGGYGGHGGHGDGYGGGYGDDARDPSGAYAGGGTEGSPGVGSGNAAQVPVDVPVNLCGNTIDVIAALNPVFGNSCHNEEEPPGYGDTPPVEEEQPPGEEEQPPPPVKETPPPAEEVHTPPAPHAEQPPALAETGSEGTLGAAAAGAVLIAGGAILYRRGRIASRR